MKLKDLNLGDKVYFGRYIDMQLSTTNNSTFDVIPFKWIVVNIDADKITLAGINFSYGENSVIYKPVPYDNSKPGNPNLDNGCGWNNWKYSNFRQWLNSDKACMWYEKQHQYDKCSIYDNSTGGFLEFFTPKEKNIIYEVENKFWDNINRKIDTCVDKVWIPTLEQLGYTEDNVSDSNKQYLTYVGDDSFQFRDFSDYVNSDSYRIATRSFPKEEENKSYNSYMYMIKYSSGSSNGINIYASNITNYAYYVPCCVVDGNIDLISETPNDNSFYQIDGRCEMTLGDLSLGEHIIFGSATTYDSNAERQKWQIVSDEEDSYILFNEDHHYHNRTPFDIAEPNSQLLGNKSDGYNNWKYSNMRQWLNSKGTQWYEQQHQYDEITDSYNNNAGYMTFFTDEELKYIKDNTIKFYDCVDDVERQTIDKVFIPSIQQLGYETSDDFDNMFPPISDKPFDVSYYYVGFGGLPSSNTFLVRNAHGKYSEDNTYATIIGSCYKDRVSQNGYSCSKDSCYITCIRVSKDAPIKEKWLEQGKGKDRRYTVCGSNLYVSYTNKPTDISILVQNPVKFSFTIVNNVTDLNNKISYKIYINDQLMNKANNVTGNANYYYELSVDWIRKLSLGDHKFRIEVTNTSDTYTNEFLFNINRNEVPNYPPTAPSNLRVTNTNGTNIFKDGDTVTLLWEASSDDDNDDLTYDIHYYNGKSWILIKAGNRGVSYDYKLDTQGNPSVKFKVRAYDGKDYGEFLESDEIPITYDVDICQVDVEIENTDYGNKYESFRIDYKIGSNRTDNENVFIKVLVDGTMYDYILNPFK